MSKHFYYLTINKNTGEYRCDGTYESAASCKRHLDFLWDHNENLDWATLIKNEEEEPLSAWEVNLISNRRKQKV